LPRNLCSVSVKLPDAEMNQLTPFLCPTSNQVEYLLRYHGHTYLGEKGEALAIYDKSRKVFKSDKCQALGEGKRVCAPCASHAKNVSSAIWRLSNANAENWKFTPNTSIRGLLAKDSFIQKLRSEITYLNDKVKNLEAAAAEDINLDKDLDEKESESLVKMLISVIEKGYLKPESFTFCIIKQQLACLLQVRDDLHSGGRKKKKKKK